MLTIQRFWLLAVCFLSAQAMAAPDPVPMLSQTANQIIQTLQQHQSSLKQNPQVVNKAIQTYLLPHVDVLGMARSVLGRQAWTTASAEEKKQFTEQFTQLVVRTYATPLAEYSGETMSFSPVRGGLDSKFLRVSSVVNRPNGQKIPLDYNLVYDHQQWKIFDLNVEGVSLLQSFRTQFADRLQQVSLKELIHDLRKTKRA